MIVIAKTSLNALLGGTLKADYDIGWAFIMPEKRHTLDALLSSALERHPLIHKAQKVRSFFTNHYLLLLKEEKNNIFSWDKEMRKIAE